MKQEDKMSKTKLVPFDIEKAKNGAKVVTRDGLPVKIVDYPIKNEDYPILGLVLVDGSREFPLVFTKTGNQYENSEGCYDLFIEEEVEEDDSDYDPYKSTVESIADMVERYSELQTLEELKHFYNNVKIKCRDAFEYGKVCMINQDEGPDDNKPKFQEGDWVVFNPGCNAHQIVRVVENATSHTYGYDTVDDYYFNDTEESVRLWNINDAKDGDVLACDTCIVLFKKIDGLNIKCHCTYHFMDTPMFFVDTLQNKTAFYPATKEQCDLLFQKMKEAGYAWDKEKKELKKIENEENEERSTRMTNRELALWLRSCPEEFRECKYLPENTICYAFSYREDDADKPVEDFFAIRRNGGEWQEPLIEL